MSPHPAEHIARAMMMANGEGKWDLSPNDRAAIQHVIDRMRVAEGELAKRYKDDRFLAWAILKDLSDRAGIPEWLGSESDDAAKDVANDLAALIGSHRELSAQHKGKDSQNST